MTNTNPSITELQVFVPIAEIFNEPGKTYAVARAVSYKSIKTRD